MTRSQMLWNAHGAIEIQSDRESGDCILCGLPAGISIKKYIKPTFTNRDLFLYPNSPVICQSCAFVMTNQGYRYKMFICTDEEFVTFSRDEASEHLFNPPRIPFICAIPSSYHKHLWLHCKINYNHSKYQIRFENVNVILEPAKHRKWFDDIEVMYSIFSKTEIETGNYYPVRIEKFGKENFIKYEKRISEYRKYVSVFSLLLYIANKKENLCPKSKPSIEQKQPKPKSKGQLSLF